MKPYILDDASALEYKRLDLMSKILDPWTRGYLSALGVGEGWQCLELGGGNGSISEWLCDEVGVSGSVTVIDINPVLLELIPAHNLTVQQMDLRTGELPQNAYDLVTCRAMLHHMPEETPALLARMAAAVKPGGWLFVQEPDLHLGKTAEPETWATLCETLIEWGHDQGVDWLIGRRLPGMVSALGLGHPRATTDVLNIRGGQRAALWCQLFLYEAREQVIGSGKIAAETYDAASALLDDPDYWTQAWMFTSVW
ncbi:MAG: class I SAM-dependent methyltransferase, partial [Rubrobacteraceae bacterium]